MTASNAAQRWKPNVTVAAIVESAGRYLLVEEETAEGLRLNNPAGHLDPGESLLQAVVREVLEETACVFTPTHLIGVYLAPQPPEHGGVSYLRFAFGGHGRTLQGAVEGMVLWPESVTPSASRTRIAAAGLLPYPVNRRSDAKTGGIIVQAAVSQGETRTSHSHGGRWSVLPTGMTV